MNIARVGLLAVAIAAAGAAAFLVRTLTHKPAHETAQHQLAQAPATQVLVAARALEPGVVVKPGDFRWQAWPAEALSPNFLTEQAAPQSIKDTVGATLRAHVDLGEPITSVKLVRGETAGFLAAMLTPGMRAISTKIDEDTAAGGFILPGDHVDVVMTRRLDRSSDGGAGEDFESRTVLSDVKVLAIGQASDDSNGEKTIQGKTATLELAPQQAELLALADAMGEIKLLLRSAANSDITGAIGPKAGALGGRGGQDGAIRVVRYSHASRVMPVASISSGDGR